MKRSVVAALLASAVAPVSSVAQSVNDLAGTYVLAAETRETDGIKTALPTQGALSLGSNGRYMLTTFAPNLPKVASGNRMTASPEEYKVIVSGSLAHYGTYSIVDKVLVFKVERSTFPNWDGMEQRRQFTLTGDELKYTLANASGGGSVTLTWKRVN
jgi:Lipocalin-like domain